MGWERAIVVMAGLLVGCGPSEHGVKPSEGTTPLERETVEALRRLSQRFCIHGRPQALFTPEDTRPTDQAAELAPMGAASLVGRWELHDGEGVEQLILLGSGSFEFRRDARKAPADVRGNWVAHDGRLVLSPLGGRRVVVSASFIDLRRIDALLPGSGRVQGKPGDLSPLKVLFPE